MTDYRRIAPDDLVTQAHALGSLAADLETTARRVDGTLAAAGRGGSTTAIVEAARWMDGWASTMTGKAAIAATAVSLPAAPAVPGGSAPAAAPGTQVVLKTVSVPRWVERPMLAVQELTQTVSRAVAKTTLVQELRASTERVLERIPVTTTVTQYREVQRTFTEWREVSIPQSVPRVRTVIETVYRQVPRVVTSSVPVYHQVTNLVWNGRQYVARPMTIVEYRQVSYTEWASVPVQVSRTVTDWVQQWVKLTVPITLTKTVLEPYVVTIRSWIEQWVTRPVEHVVTVSKRVIGSATQTSTVKRSTAEQQGAWVWDERQILEEVPIAAAAATRSALGPASDPSPPPVPAPRPAAFAFRPLNEVGATAAEVAAYQASAALEEQQARRAEGGLSLTQALGRVAEFTAAAYGRAQQTSLGFFTGTDPLDSVRQALQGLSGEQQFSANELGFARLAEPGSRLQHGLAGIGEQLVDPMTLGTIGAGGAVRVFTAAAIAAGTGAAAAAEALGATKGQQQLAQLVGATFAGLGSATAIAKQAAVRTAQAVEAANAVRVGQLVADAKAAGTARLAERFGSPEAAAQALRSATPGSPEAMEITALIARDATHVQGPANRIVLGRAVEGGGYKAEVQANGGIWYESSPGVYSAAGPELTWDTNEAFLQELMEAGVGRIEFRGVDMAAELKAYTDTPLESLPSRVKEMRYLADQAEAFGFVGIENGFQLLETMPQGIAKEVGIAATAGTTAELARQQ
ncbi:MAG: hypothetical protein WEB13_07640 [Dehalococcoidia bacterium]